MQLPWNDHFFNIIIPSWQAYLAAERRLSEAAEGDDGYAVEHCRYGVLRESGAACFYLHHFAEVVLRAHPDWLPSEISDCGAVRNWVGAHCTMLRSDNNVADVALLGDVTDALKHSILTRRLDERDVSASEAVLVLTSGWGELSFGESKWGGGEQVIVLAKSRKRALGSVLQNVIDAWRRVAGIKLPEIGAP